MKKIVDMVLVAAMLLYSIPGLAENVFPQDVPPAQSEQGDPPFLPDGMPAVQRLPATPSVQRQNPRNDDAAATIDSDNASDENAMLVVSANVSREASGSVSGESATAIRSDQSSGSNALIL